MLIFDVIVALAVGLFTVWIVSFAFGTKGPWGSFLLFFLVVSLFAWAGGVWLVPFGPRWWGIGWFPIIVMGVFVSLLLTAASPRTPRKSKGTQKDSEADTSKVIIDVIFWILILCLMIFGFGHYVWFPSVG